METALHGNGIFYPQETSPQVLIMPAVLNRSGFFHKGKMKLIENDAAYVQVCIEAAWVKELGGVCVCVYGGGCCRDCCWIRISA